MSPTNINYETIWNRVLETIEQDELDQIFFREFVKPTTLVGLEDGKALILVQKPLQAQVLKTTVSLLDKFTSAIQKVTETNYVAVFLTNEEYETTHVKDELEDNPFEQISFSNNLNADKTFENFISGTENNEAYAASVAVANQPGHTFNPLFIYGDTGLGKTHLLNAIGNRVKQSGTQKIKMMTSKEFIDNFLTAKNKNTIGDLEKVLMNLDLLLIDDVQFFVSKPATGELFFNIFNNLIQNRKQVVITSDKHPNELRGLEERLVSRFKSGLTTTISCPTVELAKIIIDSKIKSMNFDPQVKFTEEALFYIAENNNADVRGIEGALTKISFNLCLYKRDLIDLDFLLEIFKDETAKVSRKLNGTKIKNEVADYFKVEAKKLEGDARVKQIATARHIAIYMMRKYVDISYPMIGQEMGGRNHSTMMSSYKKIEKELKTNEQTIKTIENLKKRLGLV